MNIKEKMAKLRAMKGKGKGKKTSMPEKGHMMTDKEMTDSKMDMKKKMVERIGQRAKTA